MRKLAAVLLVVGCLLSLLSGCRSGIDLGSAEGQMRFGLQAARMNLWREARFRFERAVELEPGDAMALNNLAVALEGTGEFERARQAYLAALQRDRSNQYIQRNYSRFVEFYSRHEKEAVGHQDQPAERSAAVPPSPPESASPASQPAGQAPPESEEQPPETEDRPEAQEPPVASEGERR